jgi:hypothetical protein
MCVSDSRSQKQGDHEGRPYETMSFVGAGFIPARARNTNGTDGAIT